MRNHTHYVSYVDLTFVVSCFVSSITNKSSFYTDSASACVALCIWKHNTNSESEDGNLKHKKELRESEDTMKKYPK